MGSTTIKPFPELVELATREATDIQVRMGIWLSAVGVEALRAAVLAQLCDLTRPASRDAVARLVAGRIGWTPATVILAMETTGAIRARLHRDCGVPAGAPTSGSAAEALVIVVRHLWPEGAPDAR